MDRATAMREAAELIALAERVEAHNPNDTEAGYALGREVIEAASPGGVAFWTLASPLYSLDAARSLVPEGWRYTVSTEEPGPYAWVGVSGAGNPAIMGATPELALVAAALRARAEAGE